MPKKRVLFIDSDNAFVEQWVDIIQKSGVEVIKNQDGSAGLVLAKTYQPNLIVLGLELLDMNGYLVCKRLREDEGTKSIPLFVTSSTATEKDFEKHKKLRVRADEYFHKPVDEKSFKEKLSVLLGVRLTSEKGDKMVDDAEVVALKDKIKSMEVDIELLKKDLEDAHNSRKELAKSLGMQLDIEKEKVKKAQNENELLKEQLKILENDKRELSNIVDKLESENKKREREYREKLNDYESKIGEIERIKGDLEKSEREKEKYKNEISQFRGELTRFKDRVVELEEIAKEKDKELRQVDALSERARELEERVAVLESEKEKIETDLKEAQNENNTELITLMDQINRVTEEKSGLLNELNETKIEIEKLRTLLKEKEEDFERAISEKATLEEMLKNKDKTINEKEAIILELDQKVESQLSRIEDTEKQLKEKEEMLEKLNQRLLQIREEESAKGDGFRERIKELESQIAEKEEELLRFKGISERINELEAELSRTKTSEEELKRRLLEMEELRKKDEEFLNTLDRVVREKDELLKRVKELEEEKAIKVGAQDIELEQEVSSLKAQLKEKEQEIKNLKELVEIQMEEKSSLEKEIKELKANAEKSKEVISPESAPEEIVELVEEKKKEMQKEDAGKEELLILDESTVVEQNKEARTEESDLVSMLDNIWEDSKGLETVVEGEKPKEEFFEESEIIGVEEKDTFTDPESMEWKQLITQYNNIFNLIFVQLVPENGKEPAQAIWEEFLSEQDDKEKLIFENVTINNDGTLSTLEIVKNLKRISEGGKMGKIAGLDNLYINQKLKSKLNEFVDFMMIIAKRKLKKSESENLIKSIKEKQKSIK